MGQHGGTVVSTIASQLLECGRNQSTQRKHTQTRREHTHTEHAHDQSEDLGSSDGVNYSATVLPRVYLIYLKYVKYISVRN